MQIHAQTEGGHRLKRRRQGRNIVIHETSTSLRLIKSVFSLLLIGRLLNKIQIKVLSDFFFEQKELDPDLDACRLRGYERKCKRSIRG